MLNFILKKNWYEKIKSGEKTIEYREVKPYWTKRFERAGCENNKGDVELLLKNKIACLSPVIKAKCILRLGYTKQYMTARITSIEVVNGKNTDLAIDKPVYAIQLSDVQEIKEVKKNG